MSAYAHPVASVYANVCADVQRKHLHLHGAHNTCRNACIFSAKNAHAIVRARLCNGAEASLPWKLLRTYLESCASIVQAVVRRPPSYRLNEISRLIRLVFISLRLAFFRHSIFLMFHTSFWNIAPLYFVNRFFIILALVCHQNGYYLHEYFDLWTQ